MLQALQALHDLGIVHRDLKPSNVFLTLHGVKLLDFGWPERRMQPSPATQTRREQLHHSLPPDLSSTPLYMAPEQAGVFPQVPPRTSSRLALSFTKC